MAIRKGTMLDVIPTVYTLWNTIRSLSNWFCSGFMSEVECVQVRPKKSRAISRKQTKTRRLRGQTETSLLGFFIVRLHFQTNFQDEFTFKKHRDGFFKMDKHVFVS